MNLRPYQLDCLNSVKNKYSKGIFKQLIVAPTGTGKTCIFASLPQHLNIKGRVLVLIHREELAEQAADKIIRWNPQERVGIEMATRRAYDNRVVVASVQTIGRLGSERLEQFKPETFDLIITDEAHHSTSQSYKNIYAHFGVLSNYMADPMGKGAHILHIGVTATPNRSDGTGLHEVFDEIVYNFPLLTAIKEGWLANIRGYRVSTGQSLDEVHTRAGEFATDELENAVNNTQRNNLCVKHWKELAQERQTVVFCVGVSHAIEMAKTFRDNGVAAESVHGNDEHRAQKLDELRSGKIRVLCNCAILLEGYDDWHISCIVHARPTKSQLLFTQATGRGLRIPDNINNLQEARLAGIPIAKEDCILIDVVDSTTKHSLVTLPTLFGLGEKLDMKGRTITATLDHFNSVQQAHPNADLKDAQDITKLNSYATSIDLFSIRWASEILEANSLLQWHKTVDGHYVLYLRGGRIDVFEDLLNRWNVVGQAKTDSGLKSIDQHGLSDLPTGLHEAEDFVRKSCPEELTLLRREASWHKNPATDAQIKLLKKFHIPIKPGLTKGEGQLAISKLLKRR